MKYRRDSRISRGSSISKSKVYVPSCVFSKRLSSFETIVKFLRENYGFGFEETSQLLGKKRQSVWRAYQSSVSKFKKSFEVTNLYYPIPVSIFKDSKCSLLETLVVYLREEYELSYSEISALLMRDDRTVWTVYHRATRKQELSGVSNKFETKKRKHERV